MLDPLPVDTERQDIDAARAFCDRVSRVYNGLAHASEHESCRRGLELLAEPREARP